MSDIVIVGAKRTAIGSFLGQFTGVPTPTLGATAIKAALEQAGVPPADVSEVIMGCVLPANLGQAPARQAALAAGLPPAAGCTTINKVCGSGMKAIMLAPRPDQGRLGRRRRRRRHGIDDQRAAHASAFAHRQPLRQRRDGRPHGLGRPDQSLRRPVDGRVRRAVRREVRASRASSRTRSRPNRCKRAQAAIASGAFADEIVPVKVADAQGRGRVRHRRAAGQVRHREDPDAAAGVQARNGTITAASSSSISDGAAATGADERGRSGQARHQAAGAHRRPRHAFAGTGVVHDRAGRRDRKRAEEGRLERRRRRPVRGQRGVRGGRDGADEGARHSARQAQRQRRRAARSAIRSAPPARAWWSR